MSRGRYSITLKPFGPTALLIEWPQRMDRDILNDITTLQTQLGTDSPPGILELVPAYASLGVLFDPAQITFEQLCEQVLALYQASATSPIHSTRCWDIPVCYALDWAPDLEALATAKDVSIAKVIQWHTQPVYCIHFIGFLPGFLYLGGLDPRLHSPRLATPRSRVAAGSVGIGGAQTGIYPVSSPGGWQLIGRSPVRLFDPDQPHPCFARAGDELKFRAIDQSTFLEIEAQVQAGQWQPKILAEDG